MLSTSGIVIVYLRNMIIVMAQIQRKMYPFGIAFFYMAQYYTIECVSTHTPIILILNMYSVNIRPKSSVSTVRIHTSLIPTCIMYVCILIWVCNGTLLISRMRIVMVYINVTIVMIQSQLTFLDILTRTSQVTQGGMCTYSNNQARSTYAYPLQVPFFQEIFYDFDDNK